MSIAKFCDVMALIRKAPRTERELVEVVGLDPKTVQHHIAMLRSEGHIRISGMREPTGRGKPARLYAWQTTLFGEPDAEVSPTSGIPSL